MLSGSSTPSTRSRLGHERGRDFCHLLVRDAKNAVRRDNLQMQLEGIAREDIGRERRMSVHPLRYSRLGTPYSVSGYPFLAGLFTGFQPASQPW